MVRRAVASGNLVGAKSPTKLLADLVAVYRHWLSRLHWTQSQLLVSQSADQRRDSSHALQNLLRSIAKIKRCYL
jgi:deferrochelatase/peroxidase EfeB